MDVEKTMDVEETMCSHDEAIEYRRNFWKSHEEQEKVVGTLNSKTYSGFFTRERILMWAESINDRDVAFRLGYTLGFSKMAVNSFTGIFHIDYDRKADSMFHDAIYEFIVNYLVLTPNESDFRFYRRVREILKLSALPFDISGSPHGAHKSLKAILKRETHEYTMECRFRDKYKDNFMEWLLSAFKDKKDYCLAVFNEIVNKKKELEPYKHILCLDEIEDYLKKIKKKDEYDKKLKLFKDYASNCCSEKIKMDNKKKQEALPPADNEQSSTPDNEQSSTPDNEQRTRPEYPSEEPPLIECPLFKAVKIYSTIKGYRMKFENDTMKTYEEKLRKVFTDKLLCSFFPVDRKLQPNTVCVRSRENDFLFSNQRLINVIRVIDSHRTWNGDILRKIRNHSLELEKLYPNCRWLRTFLVLCLWRAKWSDEKFALTLDRFLLHKDYDKLAVFRDLSRDKLETQKVFDIKGSRLDKIFGDSLP